MTKNIAKFVTTRHKRQWTIIEYFKLTVISHLHQTCFQLKSKQKHNNPVVCQMCISIYCMQSNKNLVIIYQIYINDLSNKRNSVSR